MMTNFSSLCYLILLCVGCPLYGVSENLHQYYFDDDGDRAYDGHVPHRQYFRTLL
jgi:hypothetical protein